MTTCRQCDLLVAAGEIPARCGDCGAELRRARATAWRPRRGVEGMLLDLVAARRYLCALPGARSTMNAALDAASSGIWGRGCSTVYAVADDLPYLPAPSPEERHYRALHGLPGHRARRLFVEGVVQYVDSQTVDGTPLTLEQAVGRHCASADALRRVRLKIATRDRRPALAALETIGAAALRLAADEWSREIDS